MTVENCVLICNYTCRFKCASVVKNNRTFVLIFIVKTDCKVVIIICTLRCGEVYLTETVAVLCIGNIEPSNTIGVILIEIFKVIAYKEACRVKLRSRNIISVKARCCRGLSSALRLVATLRLISALRLISLTAGIGIRGLNCRRNFNCNSAGSGMSAICCCYCNCCCTFFNSGYKTCRINTCNSSIGCCPCNRRIGSSVRNNIVTESDS